LPIKGNPLFCELGTDPKKLGLFRDKEDMSGKPLIAAIEEEEADDEDEVGEDDEAEEEDEE